jgi:hypothetical protein
MFYLNGMTHDEPQMMFANLDVVNDTIGVEQTNDVVHHQTQQLVCSASVILIVKIDIYVIKVQINVLYESV